MITKEEENTLKTLLQKADSKELNKIFKELEKESEQEEKEDKENLYNELFQVKKEKAQEYIQKIEGILKETTNIRRIAEEYGIERSHDAYKAFILGTKIKQEKKE